jgi:hypothetical protein
MIQAQNVPSYKEKNHKYLRIHTYSRCVGNLSKIVYIPLSDRNLNKYSPLLCENTPVIVLLLGGILTFKKISHTPRIYTYLKICQ